MMQRIMNSNNNNIQQQSDHQAESPHSFNNRSTTFVLYLEPILNKASVIKKKYLFLRVLQI